MFKTFFEKLSGPELPLRERAAQKLRFFLQLSFLALTVLIGLEFSGFVVSILQGGALSRRPPGVDGFLPISSLMSLRFFAGSGELHRAHPAGLFILLAVLAVSFVVGKSFCGWLCPFGFVSELFHKARKLACPSIKPPPAWLDYALGAVKYLILAFFVYIIFFAMDMAAVKSFLDGEYNRIADIKMYYFFVRITPLAAFIAVFLLLASFFVSYFWCRYLCPYGALLGLVSLASPLKIKRHAGVCVNCGLCAAVCPQSIKVDKTAMVFSDECTSCALCLDVCPAPGALEMRVRGTGVSVKTVFLPLLVSLVFCLITGLAMLSGNWRNNVSADDYRRLTVNCDSLEHPR